MLRKYVLAGALACSVQSAFGQELSDSQAAQTIETTWNSVSSAGLTYGDVVIAGFGTNICGNPVISWDELKVLLAAQTVGLVSISVDRAQNRAHISLTPFGMQTDITASMPPKYRLSNCMHFKDGTFKVNRVVKNDLYKKGVNDYRVIFLTYTASWNALYRKIMQLRGVILSDDRKAIALLKFDAFNNKWVIVAADIGDADREFQTNNVARALAVAN